MPRSRLALLAAFAAQWAAAAVDAATCSTAEAQTTTDLYAAVAATAACSPYAVTTSTLTYISGPCTATACIAELEVLVTELPDCELDGNNEKTQLEDALAICGSTVGGESTSSPEYTDIPVVAKSSTGSSASATGSASTSLTSSECSEQQLETIKDVYLEAAGTTECSEYMSTTSLQIYAPCSASDCLAVLEDMTAKVPDCLYEGDNIKESLETALASCDGTTASSTAYTDIPVVTKATTSSSSSSSTSGSECSTSEQRETATLYVQTANADACANYSTTTMSSVAIDPPCSATACLADLVELADQLPDCEIEGVNYKTGLVDGLASCGYSSESGGSNAAAVSSNSIAGSNSADPAAARSWAAVLSAVTTLSIALLTI